MIAIEIIALIASVSLLFRLWRFGVLSPVFLVACHLVLGFVVKSIYSRHLDPEERSSLAPRFLDSNLLLSWDVVLLMLVVGVSLLLFLSRRLAPIGRLQIVRTEGSISERQIWMLAFACAISVFGGLALLSSALGGVERMAFVLSSRVVTEVTGLGYLTLIPDIGVAASIVAYWGVADRRRRVATKVVVYISVALSVLYLMLAGGRANLIQYFLSMAIIDSYVNFDRYRRFGSRMWVVSISIVAPIVIIIGAASRAATQFGTSLAEQIESALSSVAAMLLYPFALVDQYSLAKIFAERNGHDSGYIFLSTIFKPIPRVLWPDKPESIAMSMRWEFRGDLLGGIPPGLFGEFYISFGIAGVVLGAVLLAWGAIWFTRVHFAAMKDRGLRVFVALIGPYFCFNLIRSGWDISFTRMAIYLGALLILRALILVSAKPAYTTKSESQA